MAQVNPKMPPASDTNFSSVAWQRFFHDLFARVTLASMIAWTQISTVGSNLTDLATRNHNDLQNSQGGSATEEYHLTAADYTGLGTGLVVRQSTVSLLISVISATATDIFGAAGATISINNSTPVTTTSFTACTSNQVGSVKRVIPVQNWSVTASANLVVDGATSGTYVMPAGAKLEVLASTTTLFILTTIQATGTWTPNQGAGLTVVGAFSSAGDWVKVGREITLRGYVAGATSVALAAAGVLASNAPFTSASGAIIGYGKASNIAFTVLTDLRMPANSTSPDCSTAIAATALIEFNVKYFV
jgi:hypothetical protein